MFCPSEIWRNLCASFEGTGGTFDAEEGPLAEGLRRDRLGGRAFDAFCTSEKGVTVFFLLFSMVGNEEPLHFKHSVKERYEEGSSERGFGPALSVRAGCCVGCNGV